MKTRLLITIAAWGLSHSGCSQTRSHIPDSLSDVTISVGGSCENCEAVYDAPYPFAQLKAEDTLPDYNEPGPKLHISGTIYQPDGRTPAANVVLYIYHTNQAGIYASGEDLHGAAKKHGYIRGWIKTGVDGRYSFYTLVPAAYPQSNMNKHIHPIIKEPGKSPYWIDDFVFDDDPFLHAAGQPADKPRGGSGLLKPVAIDGILTATRDIVLGMHVNDYPKLQPRSLQSGLNVGEDCPAFDPLHLSGADAGTRACPMCKYGFGKGVMVWFNHYDTPALTLFAKKMEQEMERRGTQQLRVFFVCLNPQAAPLTLSPGEPSSSALFTWCRQQAFKRVAVVMVPSPTDAATAGVFKINPVAVNTVMVYRKRKVVASWVNMVYNHESVERILQLLN